MKHSQHPRRDEGGYTLVIVVVVLAVLTVAGAAAIDMASDGIQGAAGVRRRAFLRSCAQQAKAALISEIRFDTGFPSSFDVEIIRPTDSERILDLAPGHDPQNDAPVVTDLVGIPPGMEGRGKTPSTGMNITNRIRSKAGTGTSGVGTSAARINARCRDSGGRYMEVEFLVRYGI